MIFLGRELRQDAPVHHQRRDGGAAPLINASVEPPGCCCCFPAWCWGALPPAARVWCSYTQEPTSKYVFKSVTQAVLGGVTLPEVVFTLLSWPAVAVLRSFCSTSYNWSLAPPAITCCGSVGIPVAANGSTLVEMEAKFLGSNARICAFTGRYKGLCFFYPSRNKRLVVAVAFVC